MATKEPRREDDPKRNPDPITKAPGSHPVGSGIGAAAGGAAGIGGAIAAGAVMGTAAGPIGTAVGAAVGGVVGGLIGKGVAEGVNPTVEETYWRENYSSRPYVAKGAKYEEYAPAYRYGWEGRRRYEGKRFDEVEADMAREWYQSRGTSKLDWDQARQASRDAWERISGDKDEE
jgi:hypothetical protein